MASNHSSEHEVLCLWKILYYMVMRKAPVFPSVGTRQWITLIVLFANIK